MEGKFTCIGDARVRQHRRPCHETSVGPKDILFLLPLLFNFQLSSIFLNCG